MKSFVALLVAACLVASAYSATCSTAGTNVGNCGGCTSTNACSSCLAAFSFVSATPACSAACPPQCLYCVAGSTASSTSACQNLNSSATAATTTTLALSTCNPNGTAVTASSVTTTTYYTPGAQSSGVYECYTCGVANCSNCNDPAASPTAASSNGGNANCRQCVAGTYLNGNTTALLVNSVQQGTKCTVCPAISTSVQCLSCYNASYCLTATGCPTGTTFNLASQTCKGAFRLAAVGSVLVFVLAALAL